jgi:linoleate 8R-lipoxygenase/9,12-octadecadienoate 8-hydroperoxide 8R-isomerase
MARTFKDGNIKPDCFSEKRILGFPPGVEVLLIMFNQRPLGKATHEELKQIR